MSEEDFDFTILRGHQKCKNGHSLTLNNTWHLCQECFDDMKNRIAELEAENAKLLDAESEDIKELQEILRRYEGIAIKLNNCEKRNAELLKEIEKNPDKGKTNNTK